MTLQAFQALAHYLSQFPGRKNVMWISGSFPSSGSIPSSGSPARERTAVATARLNGSVGFSDFICDAGEDARAPTPSLRQRISPHRSPVWRHTVVKQWCRTAAGSAAIACFERNLGERVFE